MASSLRTATSKETRGVRRVPVDVTRCSPDRAAAEEPRQPTLVSRRKQGRRRAVLRWPDWILSSRCSSSQPAVRDSQQLPTALERQRQPCHHENRHNSDRERRFRNPDGHEQYRGDGHRGKKSNPAKTEPKDHPAPSESGRNQRREQAVPRQPRPQSPCSRGAVPAGGSTAPPTRRPSPSPPRCPSCRASICWAGMPGGTATTQAYPRDSDPARAKRRRIHTRDKPQRLRRNGRQSAATRTATTPTIRRPSTPMRALDAAPVPRAIACGCQGELEASHRKPSDGGEAEPDRE